MEYIIIKQITVETICLLYIRYHSQYFIDINSFNSLNNTIKKVLLLSPAFHTCGNNVDANE